MRRDGATMLADAAKAKARKELSTVSKCENRLLEHKRKACDIYTKLSAEARPILMNNSMALDGAVVDFLGSERLTRLVESRRQHRVGVANAEPPAGPDEAIVKYSICVGTVANVKCKESTPTEGVYVADREGRYGTTKFSTTAGKYEATVDTKAIPGITNLFEARYVSVISHQVDNIAAKIRAAFSNRDMQIDTAMADEVVEHLRDMASESSKIVYSKPAYTLPPYNTADYSIHVLSLSGTVKELANYVLNIHRTLVVAERTFVHGDSRHAIPLCEEVVVEFVQKDSVDTVRKRTLTPKSLVLTAVVSVEGGAKPASVLHYFGSNACTTLFSNISHVNRDNRYASTHDNGMYVAGWMVRQLANICSETGIQNTSVDVFSKFFTSAPAYASGAVAPSLAANRQFLRHTFLGRQDAQKLLTTDGKKLFYTKVWKATPTICVICISPLSNLSANNVFVWSIGSGFEAASRGGYDQPRSRSLSRGAAPPPRRGGVAPVPRRIAPAEDGDEEEPPRNHRSWSEPIYRSDDGASLPEGPRTAWGGGDNAPFSTASMLSPELELELELL